MLGALPTAMLRGRSIAVLLNLSAMSLDVTIVTPDGEFNALSSPQYVTLLKNPAKVSLKRLPHIIYHAVSFWPVGEFDIVFKLPEATDTISLAIETTGEPLTSPEDAKAKLLTLFSSLV